MWIPKFNEYLMRYRENGDLERMQRFWFTGACEPRKRRRTSSKPLALAQFMSAFLLLGIGITFSGLLLLFEHCYFKYLRKYLARFRNTEWVQLISIDVAESLEATRQNNKLEGNYQSNQNIEENGIDECTNALDTELDEADEIKPDNDSSCLDPLCNMNIDSVTQELQVATERIKILKMQLAQINQTNGNGGIRQRIITNKQQQHQNIAEIETVL